MSKLGITEVVLRDAHQSLLATRLRLDDMLPIAEKLDQIGYWSIESWGGATFDACIRYLGEDPWLRIRKLKEVMPNTPQQMLLRGQNLLGYRHYADDVVGCFVHRAVESGVDVFRIFDAMNDPRNMSTSIAAVKREGRHAQGTLSYTRSPVHTLESWLDLARRIEDMEVDSICIKDMAGLLRPYEGYELVSRLKKIVNIPIHMQSHATTGLSTATYLKCIEAGIDNIDTAISSMSMTYGHTSTESMVAILEDQERQTGLDLVLLEEVAQYFRKVRKKYAQFEGTLKGVDARILVAQVPGGMLTNMEHQLKDQDAFHLMDKVLEEIPRVREDLGFIPLVTPTSQIVGTQAVMNVLSGERYKSVAKETAGVLKGEYGATPGAVNRGLQKRVLGDAQPISCRPADCLSYEMDDFQDDLEAQAKLKGIRLSEDEFFVDDVLIHAMFPNVGLRFLANRDNPAAFEQPEKQFEPEQRKGKSVYTVTVEDKDYRVVVENGGSIDSINVQSGESSTETVLLHRDKPQVDDHGESIQSPMAGNICEVLIPQGGLVSEGDPIVVMEAMKMEMTVSATKAGVIAKVCVSQGDAVKAGATLALLNAS